MPRCTSTCPTTGTYEVAPPRCARMAGHDGEHRTASMRVVYRDGCIATVEQLPFVAWPDDGNYAAPSCPPNTAAPSQPPPC